MNVALSNDVKLRLIEWIDLVRFASSFPSCDIQLSKTSISTFCLLC